jgi:hypothetical protein
MREREGEREGGERERRRDLPDKSYRICTGSHWICAGNP